MIHNFTSKGNLHPNTSNTRILQQVEVAARTKNDVYGMVSLTPAQPCNKKYGFEESPPEEYAFMLERKILVSERNTCDLKHCGLYI